MYQNSFYPLRTIVGDPIAINLVPTGMAAIWFEPDISIVEESQASRDLDHIYEFKYTTLTGTTTDSRYKNYFPVFESSGRTSEHGSGMDSLPLPTVGPFSEDTPVVSLFGLSNKLKNSDVSRELSVKLQIRLANPALVGGICFGGFPFLPYKLESNGQNSANFGLPREIRLISGESTSAFSGFGKTGGFLDFENSVTRQEIVSHSGFHYLQIDPTLTDSLILHLSDYPTFLTKKITPERSTGPIFPDFPEIEERYGFIIPYFYVFGYQEKTRFKPLVPAGLLGARHENNSSSLELEYTYVENAQRNNHHYFDFTAASIFGQQRRFSPPTTDRYDEAFITTPVKPREKIILYIQQAEEYRRCIAGLKMFFPFAPDEEFGGMDREQLEAMLRNLLHIPESVNFCEKIGVRVFELDPVEGVSPLLVPLDSEYATLLAENIIDQWSEILLASGAEGIKFVRPSTANFFAIELTNQDAEAGQFVVKKLQLIQSAHVSIHPRASKTQQVSALHFRLIGPNLADDYALLGEQGFNFSVERLVAGERKSVLLQVNSLLDLLHTGAARIYSNHRRRKTEHEIVEMRKEDNSYSEQETSNRSKGWSRSETGNMRDKQVQDDASWVDTSQKSDGKHGYTSLNSQESRQRMEHIGKINDAYLTTLIAMGQNGVLSRDVLDQLEALKSDLNSRLWVTETGDIWTPWKCTDQVDIDNLRSLLQVDGLWNSNIPPYFVNDSQMGGPTTGGSNTLSQLPQLPDLTQLSPDQWGSASVTFLRALLAQFGNNPGSTPAGSNNGSLPLSLLLLLNGIGLSASPGISGSVGVAGASLGLSLSASGSTPTLLKSSSVGTSGVITRQGNESCYSYAQYLNNRFDESNARTNFGDSKIKRLVTPEPVAEYSQRVTGAEVMWQGQLNDILTGSMPLNFTLPATASKEHYRTADNSLRVRFGSGIGQLISVDFWFDILEEVIQDDY